MSSASSAVITGLVYLLVGCILNDYVPRATGTATCNHQKYGGGGLGRAREELFKDLVANTFDQTNSQYCTWAGTDGGYMYGMANCAMSAPSCNGNYCSTTREQCKTCLAAAEKIVGDRCGRSVGGRITTVKDEVRCFMRYENKRIC
ncbi:hypothetical protein LINPERHAP2_LOCUS40607 [Linum perenne]